MSPAPTADILRLLAAARRVTGLTVILRDLSGRSGLPPDWRYHHGAACRRARRGRGMAPCVAFCAGTVLRELPGTDGRVHTCPLGVREIAVPVHSRERFLGVLYAGPCAGTAAADEDRRLLLDAVARRLAGLLDDAAVTGGEREARIVAWVEAGLARPLALPALARHLALSPSRCGHLVKELFGLTFPALVRRCRMQAAARLLAGGDERIATVARQVGYRDAERFAAHFRAVHGCPPSAFRQGRA